MVDQPHVLSHMRGEKKLFDILIRAMFFHYSKTECVKGSRTGAKVVAHAEWLLLLANAYLSLCSNPAVSYYFPPSPCKVKALDLTLSFCLLQPSELLSLYLQIKLHHKYLQF